MNQIFDDWERLALIVSNHFHTLRQRWAKRNVDKRKNVLLEAWPGMSRGHRPDFHALRHEFKGQEHRDAWMMLYINLEDLSKPKNLLMFLESRASEHPEYFAWRDSAPFDMATTSGAITELKAFGHKMLLSGQKNRQAYGALVSWNDESSSFDDLCVEFCFPLVEGLVILETQKRLYRFLVRCTELLLLDHDLSLSELKITTVMNVSTTKCAQRDLTSSEAIGWILVTEANTEIAYHTPQPFGFDHIRKLASAKRDEAEDELWALRENPGYFWDTVEEHYIQAGNRKSMLNRNTGPKRRDAPKTEQLNLACRSLIVETCENIVFWDMLLTDLQKLESLRASTNIRPLKRLPDSYQEEIDRFAVVVFLIIEDMKARVFTVIASSPPLQRFLQMVRQNGLPMVCLKVPSQGNNLNIPPFLELLFDLVDPQNACTLGVTNVLDEVEHLITSDSTQRSLVTATVARAISDLAAFAEIVDELIQHRCRPQLVKDHIVTEIIKAAEKRMTILRLTRNISKSLEVGTHAQRSCSFECPSLKRHNQQVIENLRAAETKLDAFWACVDEHFRRHGGETLPACMGNRTSTRKTERTPPWQPLQQSQDEEYAGITKELNIASHIEWDSFDDSKGYTGEKFLASEHETKAKTRGQANPSKTVPPSKAAVKDNLTSEKAQTFRLPSKPFKTMKALFPIDRQDHTPGKLLWKEFVQAMYKLDFSIRSMDGSEWYFEPTWKHEAPITFHEPHPSSEIPLVKLRFYANRLASKYGWGTVRASSLSECL